MVFGVFDGLHAGHRAFLRAAKKRGEELIVVVARDSAARLLKHKTPRRTQAARAAALRRSMLADRVALGDRKQGSYGVIARWKPDIICLGYDQRALANDLKKRMKDGTLSHRSLVALHPHEPEQWHTTLLAKE